MNETSVRSSPMVEIGGKPILRHIMKGCSARRVCDFVIRCWPPRHATRQRIATLWHPSTCDFNGRQQDRFGLRWEVSNTTKIVNATGHKPRCYPLGRVAESGIHPT